MVGWVGFGFGFGFEFGLFWFGWRSLAPLTTCPSRFVRPEASGVRGLQRGLDQLHCLLDRRGAERWRALHGADAQRGVRRWGVGGLRRIFPFFSGRGSLVLKFNGWGKGGRGG